MTAPTTFTITINVEVGGAISDQSVLSTFRSNNQGYTYNDFDFNQNTLVDSVVITDTHTTFTYQDGYYNATSFDPYGAPVGYTAVPTNHTADQISDIRVAGTSTQLRALAAGQSQDVIVNYTYTGEYTYNNYPYGFGLSGGPTPKQMTFHFVGVNDAPVLADGTPTLANEMEDAGAPSGIVGTSVAQLLSSATDYDAGSALGIAITDADSAHGTWWYSTDNGDSWLALNSVGEASARLIAPSDGRLYFQPSANFNGTLNAALTFHAWDMTQGTNGGRFDIQANGSGGNDRFQFRDRCRRAHHHGGQRSAHDHIDRSVELHGKSVCDPAGSLGDDCRHRLGEFQWRRAEKSRSRRTAAAPISSRFSPMRF